MLLALALVTMLEFADRALLGVLVEPVKTEFGLPDTQMGFPLGFSFVLLHVLPDTGRCQAGHEAGLVRRDAQ